MKTWSNPP
nr:unnamed protein product [Callosobruchus chinensis]